MDLEARGAHIDSKANSSTRRAPVLTLKALHRPTAPTFMEPAKAAESIPTLGGAHGYALLRGVGDAHFWTFHPWSRFSVYSGYSAAGYEPGASRGYNRARSREPAVPLYERVNRFFFGAQSPPEDPLENERRVVAAIPAGRGRIGLAAVVRGSGRERAVACPLR